MIPTLFRGFVDDAAVFPPGSASLPDAVRAHLDHRVRWYHELVGPLLVKTSQLTELPALLDRHWDGDGEFVIGVVADTGIAAVTKAVAALPAGVRVAQIEASANFIYTPLVAAAALYLCVTVPLALVLDRWERKRRR